MAQSVANIGERRPGQEQIAQPSLPPPEVAVPRAHPRRKDWALHAMGIGAILAICYFGEETLVTILVSVLLAFILAPVADLFIRLRLPRWLAAAISVGLLSAALCAAGYYGFNQASNLLSEIPKYSGKIRQNVSRITSKTHNLEVLAPTQEKTAVNVHETTSWTDLLSHGFGSATEVALAASFIPFLVFLCSPGKTTRAQRRSVCSPSRTGAKPIR